jgi:hypothetical protein
MFHIQEKNNQNTLLVLITAPNKGSSKPYELRYFHIREGSTVDPKLVVESMHSKFREKAAIELIDNNYIILG